MYPSLRTDHHCTSADQNHSNTGKNMKSLSITSRFVLFVKYAMPYCTHRPFRANACGYATDSNTRAIRGIERTTVVLHLRSHSQINFSHHGLTLLRTSNPSFRVGSSHYTETRGRRHQLPMNATHSIADQGIPRLFRTRKAKHMMVCAQKVNRNSTDLLERNKILHNAELQESVSAGRLVNPLETVEAVGHSSAHVQASLYLPRLNNVQMFRPT